MKCLFKQIRIGDPFLFEDLLYIKIDPIYTVSCCKPESNAEVFTNGKKTGIKVLINLDSRVEKV